MALEKSSPLYWLALILPLVGQFVLAVRFYLLGQAGYAAITLLIFLMFCAMTYWLCFCKKN